MDTLSSSYARMRRGLWMMSGRTVALRTVVIRSQVCSTDFYFFVLKGDEKYERCLHLKQKSAYRERSVGRGVRQRSGKGDGTSEGGEVFRLSSPGSSGGSSGGSTPGSFRISSMPISGTFPEFSRIFVKFLCCMLMRKMHFPLLILSIG